MTEAPETKTGDSPPRPPPLKLSRILHAPCETVFKAWSTAEHVRAWFSPDDYAAPEARVDMRVGGPFEVCMRSPEGDEHWARGVFVEVTPHSRLVIDMHAFDTANRPVFRAYTELDFSDTLAGTRLDVTQSYTLLDPSAAMPMVAGAPAGWRSTLGKLEREVIRMQGGGATDTHSVAHGTFHLERTYDAPVDRVWRALTDESAKQKWFGGPPGTWELIERRMDVRPGGTERLKGRWEGAVTSTFDATYYDVLPNVRLVYAYEMHLDERKISVSLATMQLEETSRGTTLKVTEQGAFLDGYDDAGSRERGTNHLLDALGASLET